jgi:integrating conjugative element protein (TIGR03761 family)
MAKKKKPEANQTAGFPTRPDSPFPDKFDLEAAKEAVKDLYESPDPDQSDPRFALLLQVWDHEEELKQMDAVDRLRDQAEPIVPFAIASQRPGRLVKPTEMALHTYQAQRLFTGRKRSEDKPGIPGMMTFAKVCYQMWLLTGNDNPYADYILIQVLQEMDGIRKEIQDEIDKLRLVLNERKERGMAHSIAASARPLVIGSLSFGSPYGYKALDLLLDFDYYVRVVTTLEEVGQIKTDEARGRKERMQHRIRSFISRIVRLGDIIRADKLLPLSRADFGPNASDDGKIRVALTAKVFGEVPEAILRGDKRPDYYKPARAPAGKPDPDDEAPAPEGSEGAEHAAAE